MFKLRDREYDIKNEFVKSVKAKLPFGTGGPNFDALINSVGDSLEESFAAYANILEMTIERELGKPAVKCICIGPPAKDCPVHGN